MAKRKTTLSELDLIASICRESFEDFCKEFWDSIPGAGNLVWGFHMSVICRELQTIAERVFASQDKEYDLIINVSPGTSKSSLASILFQPWTWTRMPQAKHINASHTDALVLDLANKARHVIKSEKYHACFPEIRIRDDQDTKGYFANTLGGHRYTCTVAGKTPMGFHGDFLGVDDALDPRKAVSEAELKIAADFQTNILPSRKVNKRTAVMFLVMQRLHDEDPTGVLLRKAREEGSAKVRHICLPAELTPNSKGEFNVQPPELVACYTDGLMDPVRLPRKFLREAEKMHGAYGFAGQFQQSPIPLSGGMFKETYFSQRSKAAPFQARRLRFWDRAATQDGGCYTAGVLMARDKEGAFYVEHVVHGQWEPDERNQRMLATARRDRSRYGPDHEPLIYVEAEGGSSGRDAWKGVARALAGFPVFEERVTGKKVARAEPWSAQLAARNVWLVDGGESDGLGRADWDVNGYIVEHCLFPMAKMKDQVDASTGAFNLLINRKQAGTLRILPLRQKAKKDKENALKVLVCTRAEVGTLELDRRALLVTFDDHPPLNDPNPLPHRLDKLLGSLSVPFAALDPEALQDRWGEPVAPYGETPEKLVMGREEGKRLWAFLAKKRDPEPEAFVLVDNGDGKALSVAYGVCDTFRIPRQTTVLVTSDPEGDHAGAEAPLRHVYRVVRSTRSTVY